MKKLLLALLAIAAVSLITEVSAKMQPNDGDGRYQRVEHHCGMCRQPKQHCHCPKEVCEKVVQAVETVPVREECIDESYCEENTTERVNSRGEKECFKVIAHEELVKPICRRTCGPVCPPEYKEVTVSGGHVKHLHPGKVRGKRAKVLEKPAVEVDTENM
jgi:hypothetical protein